MPVLQQVGQSDGLDAALEFLDVDGAVIVRDFLPPATLGRLRDDMVAHGAGHRVSTVSDNEEVRRFCVIARPGSPGWPIAVRPSPTSSPTRPSSPSRTRCCWPTLSTTG